MRYMIILSHTLRFILWLRDCLTVRQVIFEQVQSEFRAG